MKSKLSDIIHQRITARVYRWQIQIQTFKLYMVYSAPVRQKCYHRLLLLCTLLRSIDWNVEWK